MTRKLPKEAFMALAAMGWADGHLDANEAVALLRAARANGIEGLALTELELATRRPTALGDFDRRGLSRWDCLVTYALAWWIAGIDGVVSPEEVRLLDRLGVVLDLPFAIRVRVEDAAREVGALPSGAKPERYDFAELDAALARKLPHLAG